MNNSACVFCRIIKGEIPSLRVFEDEAVLAFMDIGPLAEGHLLVIPKQHYQRLQEMPGEAVARVTSVLPKQKIRNLRESAHWHGRWPFVAGLTSNGNDISYTKSPRLISAELSLKPVLPYRLPHHIQVLPDIEPSDKLTSHTKS